MTLSHGEVRLFVSSKFRTTEDNMTDKTSPAAISAKLRRAGFGIVATRNREGIRVSRGALAGTVCVSVDMDRLLESSRTADLLEAELATWEGYTFTRDGVHFVIAKTFAGVGPSRQTHDVRKAWAFLVECYGPGHSPAIADWVDSEIFAFAAKHHVDGLEAFKLNTLRGGLERQSADRLELVRIITEVSGLSRADADNLAGVIVHAGFSR